MSLNIFEQATRKKLRFPTSAGLVTVEDLWDLPLQHPKSSNLDSIAINLSKHINETKQESFVTKVTNTINSDLQLSLDIVKHIIDVKIQEQADRMASKEREEHNKRIDELIAKQQDKLLESKTIEELIALKK